MLQGASLSPYGPYLIPSFLESAPLSSKGGLEPGCHPVHLPQMSLNHIRKAKAPRINKRRRSRGVRTDFILRPPATRLL